MSEKKRWPTLDLELPGEMFETIKRLAEKEFRTPENQVLALLQEALHSRHGGYKRAICPKCGEVLE